MKIKFYTNWLKQNTTLYTQLCFESALKNYRETNEYHYKAYCLGIIDATIGDKLSMDDLEELYELVE